MEMTPGFKRTDGSTIHEQWQQFSLHEVCERISVGLATSVTQHYRKSGVPIIRNLNIKDGYFDGRDLLFVTKEFADANRQKAAKALDVLTVHTGANLGDTCVLPAEFDDCHTFTTLITTPKPNLLTPQFLCLHMSSFTGKKELARLQVGGGKGNLNTGHLRNYRIQVPPLIEQHAIAVALHDVDAILGALDRLIAKKRDLKQAAMEQLLTGQTRLPGYHGEWNVMRIGEFTDCTAGGTPSTLIASYWGGSIRWMSSGEVNLKLVEEVVGRITEEGLRNSSTKLIPKKCVLIGLAGQGKTRGTVGMNLVELCTNQSIAAIFPSPAFVPEFLYYNLDARYDELRELSAGDGGRGGLNLTIIKGIPVRLPVIPEQHSIAEVLWDMDTELVALEQRRAKTRALKQGMVQELLTGRTRLI
ncbi:MAG: restriction endonuclease subunit S [Blastocatellia bacterium]